MFIIHNLTLNKPIIPISRKVFPASFWCFERVNLLEPSISLVGKFSARQAQVNGNHQALKEKGMDVTPRELSILAVAVTKGALIHSSSESSSKWTTPQLFLFQFCRPDCNERQPHYHYNLIIQHHHNP